MVQQQYMLFNAQERKGNVFRKTWRRMKKI